MLLILSGAAAAAELPDLQQVQDALADDDAAGAVALLEDAVAQAEPGSPEERERWAVAAALQGQALLQLDRPAAAREAYRRALDWDPELVAAAEGLIHSLQLLEDWPAVQEVAASWALRPDSRPELLLIASHAARQRDDQLLALQLAQLGVARYPHDRRFRIRQAEALTASGQDALARSAWRQLTRSEPADPTWWRALAAVQQRQGDAAAARQALAIAHAQDPSDRALARDLLVSLLAAGHADASLRLARTLVGDASDPTTEDRLLAVRAAWLADAVDQARSWLDDVPTEQRSAAWQRWSLQLAVLVGDDAAARTAADALVAQGAASARIRLHAAHLAARADDAVAAEAHLRVVLQDEDPALVHLARLHLVRLLIDRDRLEEAERLIDAALAVRPTDPAANQLAALLRRAEVDQARQ